MAARYGADAVGKVGLSGAAAAEVKKGIRACRLFESVSEQVLTDLISNKLMAPRVYENGDLTSLDLASLQSIGSDLQIYDHSLLLSQRGLRSLVAQLATS